MNDITLMTDLELADHVAELFLSYVRVLSEARRMFHNSQDWDWAIDGEDNSYDDEFDSLEKALFAARAELASRRAR